MEKDEKKVYKNKLVNDIQRQLEKLFVYYQATYFTVGNQRRNTFFGRVFFTALIVFHFNAKYICAEIFFELSN